VKRAQGDAALAGKLAAVLLSLVGLETRMEMVVISVTSLPRAALQGLDRSPLPAIERRSMKDEENVPRRVQSIAALSMAGVD
jgi:hypothetical protein